MTAPKRRSVACTGARRRARRCTNYFEIPIETPIQPKLDIAGFQRVLVAGFVAGGDDEVDANLETVRLLRSQLRQKGSLRVIEAEPLALNEIAAQQDGGRAPPTSPSDTATRQDPPSADQGREGFRTVPAKFFQGRLLEEDRRRAPESADRDRLVLFRPHTTSGSFSANRKSTIRSAAAASSRSASTWSAQGFILRPTFVFIDGRTGETLHSETFREEILYNQNTQTPALSSFFELMDRLLPTFLNAMSAQKIRGLGCC